MSFSIGDRVRISERWQEFTGRTGPILRQGVRKWSEGPLRESHQREPRSIWVVSIDDTNEEVEIAELYLEPIGETTE